MFHPEEVNEEARLASEPLVSVQYVGHKAIKYDIVGGTNIAWHGHGDVRQIPRSIAERLFKHPTVWGPAEAEAPKESESQKEPENPKEPEVPAPSIEEQVQACRDKAEVEALVLEVFGVNLDKRKSLDALKAQALDLANSEADGDRGDADGGAADDVDDAADLLS